VSLALLLVGIGLAFSDIRLSGWVLGWILLSGALLVQWFRSILGYSIEHGGVDAAGYQIAGEWMGLGFSLLIVASMYMMREVLARHSLAEGRLRVISAVAQDAVVMTDNRGRVAFWNRAGQRIFGYSEEEARGKTLQELIIPERYRIDFQKKFIDFRTDGEGSASGKTVEIAGRRKDGVELVAEVSISGVKINAIWHALFIFRDITERKRAEQLLGLEYTVARCLAGTDDTSRALKAVIRAQPELGVRPLPAHGRCRGRIAPGRILERAGRGEPEVSCSIARIHLRPGRRYAGQGVAVGTAAVDRGHHQGRARNDEHF
jgi:PAS domain S-box-containing protein